LLREAWNQLETKVITTGWGVYEIVMGEPEKSDDESDGEWEEERDE
jgi:hypothetical protein